MLFVFQCDTIIASKGDNMKILKSFRIDVDVLKKLQKIADEEKRTLSNLIIKILSDFTNKK